MVTWFLPRQALCLLLCAWAIAGIACGGDSDSTGDPSSPPGGSGSSLAWDQAAGSLQQAQSFTFNLYVDQVPRSLPDAQCRSGNSGTTFTCTATLPQLGPGRHVLQLAAVLDGIESPPSDPLVVQGDTGQMTVGQQPNTSSIPAVSCVSGPIEECYQIRQIAANLNVVTGLSAAPDGRLFFVEGHTDVRVAINGTLVPEPALTLAENRARIVGLAVDPTSTQQSKFVFVAWTEQTQADQATLNVTRYRDVGNVLGEGATILTGIPVPLDGSTSLALDNDGHLYVAVPALDPSAASGVVLRLTRDGRVPPENRLGLPAFTPGFSTPSSLSLDSNQRLMWLSGRSSGQDSAISVVSVSPSSSPQAPAVVARVSSDEPVSFVLMKAEKDEQPTLFVLANGALSKALRAANGGFSGYAPLPLGEMKVAAATATSSGSMYVATETSIFELLRR